MWKSPRLVLQSCYKRAVTTFCTRQRRASKPLRANTWVVCAIQISTLVQFPMSCSPNSEYLFDPVVFSTVRGSERPTLNVRYKCWSVAVRYRARYWIQPKEKRLECVARNRRRTLFEPNTQFIFPNISNDRLLVLCRSRMIVFATCYVWSDHLSSRYWIVCVVLIEEKNSRLWFTFFITEFDR